MTSAAVAIVNYQTRELLRSCLHSALRENPVEIVVVDNASRDSSAEMVQAEFPEVKLIKNETNRGYAAAADQAMARTAEDYIFLLNSDVILKTGSIERLCGYLDQHPQVAIAGPRVVHPDGTLQPSCFPFPTPTDILLDVSHAGGIIRHVPILRNRYLRTWDHRQSRRIPWVLGAAMMIRREAYAAAGGFDRSFFMYYEEADLCYRLARKGWQIHYAPSSEVAHLGSASTQQAPTAMGVELYSSLVRFYRLHYSKREFIQLSILIQMVARARLIRDSIQLRLVRDQQSHERLLNNVTIWKRLLIGDWKKGAAHH